MSYEQLVADYKTTTGREPQIYYGESKGLDKACPAHVYPGDKIVIWKHLTGEILVEAKAHEIGHIILRHRGLVAFDVVAAPETACICDYSTYWRAKYFCQEVNNAISHRYLLPLLYSNYNIACNHQRELRTISEKELASIAEDYPDATEQLQIYGIILYDMAQCDFIESERLDKILRCFPDTKKGFDLSCQHLSSIKLDQDIGAQITSCFKFFDRLGYPRKLFKILKPFPLLNEEHEMLLEALWKAS